MSAILYARRVHRKRRHTFFLKLSRCNTTRRCRLTSSALPSTSKTRSSRPSWDGVRSRISFRLSKGSTDELWFTKSISSWRERERGEGRKGQFSAICRCCRCSSVTSVVIALTCGCWLAMIYCFFPKSLGVVSPVLHTGSPPHI